MAKTNPNLELWDPVSMKTDTLYRAGFSTLTVWLKRSGGDLYLASERSGRESDPAPLEEVQETAPAEKSQELTFSRWVVGDEVSTVQFVPAMPDRPLVVRPTAPLKIPPGMDALFYVAIPIWLRVTAGSQQGITLCELPCRILSNTWFGEPTAGELCYALRIGADKTPEESDNQAGTAVCPTTISNHTPGELALERLCVHVENFEIYRDLKRLWTNELEVRIVGDDQNSQVRIGKGAPQHIENPEKLSDARQAADNRFLKQSFSFLRSLTGM